MVVFKRFGALFLVLFWKYIERINHHWYDFPIVIFQVPRYFTCPSASRVFNQELLKDFAEEFGLWQERLVVIP